MILKLCKKTLIFDLMKVLFLGDASNMHACLARELTRMGHYAVVASDGSRWMNTPRDIDLSRPSGLTGAVSYVARLLRALPAMRGFDVVELVNPIFLKLKPWRNKPVFDYLKQHNGKVVLSALGTDYEYFKACHDGHTFRYSDYMVGSHPSPFTESVEYINTQQDNWKEPFMKSWSDYVLSRIDGAVACLWEYYVVYQPILGGRLAYAGIPISTRQIKPHCLTEVPERVRFFIGIQRDRNVLKGTDLLLAALKRVHERHPNECEMEVVENVPYADYVQRLSHSHVLLDQAYSYTPATNALLGMAQGLVAVSGAEPEYYELIGERDLRPIINVLPDVAHIERQLEWIVRNKDRLPSLSRQSRDFVVKHNDAQKVARKYLDFWQALM